MQSALMPEVGTRCNRELVAACFGEPEVETEKRLRLVLTPQVALLGCSDEMPQQTCERDAKSQFRRAFVDKLMQNCIENVARNARRVQRHDVLNARNATSKEKL